MSELAGAMAAVFIACCGATLLVVTLAQVRR
jgi:hypothetical protein